MRQTLIHILQVTAILGAIALSSRIYWYYRYEKLSIEYSPGHDNPPTSDWVFIYRGADYKVGFFWEWTPETRDSLKHFYISKFTQLCQRNGSLEDRPNRLLSLDTSGVSYRFYYPYKR